ncbi:hypothetical protein BSZ39_02110 [Bowdeniella nasicola]|uniref:Uncharacterized protein n=1 Tax=Bowdeniella nasicola TaxID=208480 RepID=A0A1Q5Q4P4_9ACTO|nr:hypothetical protein [Bowdeniella nasicola]OKL54795.1 hypothetical protein BSZ39_02110 [Bowdeniella nasicola]
MINHPQLALLLANWAAFLLISIGLGWLITVGVLRIAQVTKSVAPPEPIPKLERKPQPPEVMRGGTLIGILERFLITSAIMSGFFSLIPVVLAIKGLGRYPELKSAPGASERFIIGTLTSVAVAVVIGMIGREALAYVDPGLFNRAF